MSHDDPELIDTWSSWSSWDNTPIPPPFDNITKIVAEHVIQHGYHVSVCRTQDLSIFRIEVYSRHVDDPTWPGQELCSIMTHQDALVLATAFTNTKDKVTIDIADPDSLNQIIDYIELSINCHKQFKIFHEQWVKNGQEKSRQKRT